jgi:hypothetical protein
MNKIEVILGIIILVSAFGTSFIPNLPMSVSTVTITFKPVDLPSGASWYVTVNGVSQTSTGNQIVFTEPAGATLSYTYGDSAGYSGSGLLNTGTSGGLFYVTFPSSSSGSTSSVTPEISSFTASATSVQVGESVTLTAQATSDVGPTPYYIYIIDETTGHTVASEGSGTSATATVSESSPTSQTYIAIISAYPGLSGAISQSSPVTVAWVGSSSSGSGSGGTATTTWTVTLSASGNTLTATSSPSPSPYYLVIWDETTNTILSYNSGTSLTATGTSGHTYIAYVGDTNSPTGAEAESSPVSIATSTTTQPTVSWSVNHIALTTNFIDLNTKSITFTATASGTISGAYVEISGANGYSSTIPLTNTQGVWAGSWTAPDYGSYNVAGYFTASGYSNQVLSASVTLNIVAPSGQATQQSLLPLALLIIGTILTVDGLRRTVD